MIGPHWFCQAAGKDLWPTVPPRLSAADPLVGAGARRMIPQPIVAGGRLLAQPRVGRVGRLLFIFLHAHAVNASPAWAGTCACLPFPPPPRSRSFDSYLPLSSSGLGVRLKPHCREELALPTKPPPTIDTCTPPTQLDGPITPDHIDA